MERQRRKNIGGKNNVTRREGRETIRASCKVRRGEIQAKIREESRGKIED